MPDQADKLVKLAEQEFPDLLPLTAAEYKMLRAATRSKDAVCIPGVEEGDLKLLDTDLPKKPKGSQIRKAKSNLLRLLRLEGPRNVDKWDEDRTIRAEIFRWLCIDDVAKKRIEPPGVQVWGARIEGKIDLSSANLPFPLALFQCAVPDGIDLIDAETRTLSFDTSHIGPTRGKTKDYIVPIVADRLTVRGSLFLRDAVVRGAVCLLGVKIKGNLECDGGRFENENGNALDAERVEIGGNVFLRDGFRAQGEVNLLGAKIKGQLNCCGGRFENKNGNALFADSAEIGGTVFLNEKFHATGEVRLFGAKITGDLSCCGGHFKNKNGRALSADRVEIGGNIFLDENFRAIGEVRLLGAKIGGQLSCSGGCFENKNGTALNADSAEIGGDVFLNRNFHATGEVRLLGARITGNLSCCGGCFQNKNGDALHADGAEIGGGVFLNETDEKDALPFKAQGKVRLPGANIKGDLACSGGRFENKNGCALNADSAEIGGDVFLKKDFHATGAVRLLGVRISGNLECDGGRFENKTGKEPKALSADSAKIGGNVFLRDSFCATGEVRLLGAKIKGQLNCCGGRFENKNGNALFADSAEIGGYLFLDEDFRINGQLCLDYARAGVLQDDPKCWPQAGNLLIDGFEYGAISAASPTDAKTRKDWLERQYPKGTKRKDNLFRPQPYEQLAKVLLLAGHEEEAKKILMAKEDDRYKYSKMEFSARCWNRISKVVLGYGYRVWRVLIGAAFFVAAGWILFDLAGAAGGMVPAKEGTRPDFNAIVYSIDSFVPLVNLHQEEYWQPAGEKPFGQAARIYLWVHISAGWILTTLGLVGITGLVRKELPKK